MSVQERPAPLVSSGCADEDGWGDVEIISIEAVDEEGAPLPGSVAPSPDGTAPARASGTTALPEPACPAADRASALSAAEAALAQARAELARQSECHLRLLADFDNERRRREQEDARLRLREVGRVLMELIPVVDSLERAVESLPAGTGAEVRDGLGLVLAQAREALRRLGVAEIPGVGERFDPRLHEAVALLPRDDVEDRRVLDQLRRGYVIEGSLLRPALVTVAANPSRTDGAEEEGTAP